MTACNGALVNLGTSGAGLGDAGAGGTGGSVRHVWEGQPQPLLIQADGELLANPTLTSDERELYYTDQMRSGDDKAAHIASAVATGSGFGKPQRLSIGDSMPDASSPAVSEAGDALWLSLLGADGHSHIWLSKRDLVSDAWSAPVFVPELNLDGSDDAARPPALNGTVMPLSSKRHGGVLYQIYFSTRATVADAWGEPSQEQLGAVNSAAFQSAGGFLAEDGRALYFSSTRDGDSDLYVARRPSLDVAFGEPEPLVDLNDPDGASDERTPWLSPQGDRLYFVSDYVGQYTLYVATKLR